DANDYEFSRFHRRNADHDDKPSVVDIVLRHRRGTTLYEERLLRLRAFERARPPHCVEEIRDRANDARPERLRVGFEHHPLQPEIDRLLDKNQKTSYRNVSVFGIRRDAAGAPDANGATILTKIANDIDIDRVRIEDVLLALVELAC